MVIGDVNERRRKAALDAVERECARDLPPAELLARVNERLMTAVGYQRYGWVLLDPMTISSVSSMMTRCGLLLYSRTSAYEFSHDDAFRFRALARAPSPVATLWKVTDGDPWRRPRYRNLIGPFGGGDELRAVFRAGGLSWAVVHLGRDMADEPFSADSAAMVADVGRIVGDALRRAMAPAVPGSAAFPPAFTWNAPPGVVILNSDNEVVSLSPQAARMARQAGEADDTDLPLPVSVYAVAIQARAIAAGQGDGTPASARMRPGRDTGIEGRGGPAGPSCPPRPAGAGREQADPARTADRPDTGARRWHRADRAGAVHFPAYAA